MQMISLMDGLLRKVGHRLAVDPPGRGIPALEDLTSRRTNPCFLICTPSPPVTVTRACALSMTHDP